jgi:hypothetical protein
MVAPLVNRLTDYPSRSRAAFAAATSEAIFSTASGRAV